MKRKVQDGNIQKTHVGFVPSRSLFTLKEINWKRVWLLVMIGYLILTISSCAIASYKFNNEVRWVSIEGVYYEWSETFNR